MVPQSPLGARASNAGDDYHELWVARHALSLLDPQSGLSFITVEGTVSSANGEADSEAWSGVDCLLYYGGSAVETARSVVVEQFKYSVSDPSAPWTCARLTHSSAKSGNNSAIARLAAAFQALVQRRNGSVDGIQIRLVSNQPIKASVLEALTAQSTSIGTRQQLREASGLSPDLFDLFVKSLDLQRTGSRFHQENQVLKILAEWTHDEAGVIRDRLLRFVRKKMMPEPEHCSAAPPTSQARVRSTDLVSDLFGKR